MAHETRIDMGKQLQDLLKTEEMLAFFDFQFESETGKTISGLCKISRPKEGKAQSKYVSLLFIIDTPEGEGARDVIARLRDISWDGLKGHLAGFADALPLPSLDVGSGDFVVSEVDLYVADDVELDKRYVAEELHPAITRITRFSAEPPVFFAEAPAGAETRADEPIGQEGGSLVERVRRMLFR